MVSRISMLLALLVLIDLAVFSFATAGTCDPNDNTACSSHQKACKGTCSTAAATPCTVDTNCTGSAAKCQNIKCNCPTGLTGDKCQINGTCDPTKTTACSSNQDACKGTCSHARSTTCQNDSECTGTCTKLKCICPAGLTGDSCQTKSSSTTTRGSLTCLMLIVIPMMIQLVRL